MEIFYLKNILCNTGNNLTDLNKLIRINTSLHYRYNTDLNDIKLFSPSFGKSNTTIYIYIFFFCYAKSSRHPNFLKIRNILFYFTLLYGIYMPLKLQNSFFINEIIFKMSLSISLSLFSILKNSCSKHLM